MATNEVLSDTRIATELTWVGHGGWIAHDARFDAGDPRRVIAYVECVDHRVYVMWVRGSREVREFDSLREALRAVGEEHADPPESTW